MQATINDAGSLRKQVTVTYSQDEVLVRREKVLQKLAGQVKLDGFRPGKSSKSVVAKRFGKEAESKAREELADEGFNEAIKKHALRPIGPIKNEAVKDQHGLEITVSFDVKPVITLPEASSISVTKEDIVVSDDDLNKQLAQLCKRAGALSALTDSETIAEDDSITISGTVTVDGKEVRKLHDFHHLVGGYSLLGTKPEDVIKLLENKKIGDQLTFTTVLPKTFSPTEAAEKSAELVVTIQSAQRTRPAEANDEFAQRMGLGTVSELKERLKAQIQQNKEAELHQKQINELTDALLSKVSVEIPAQLKKNSLESNLDGRIKAAKNEKKSDEEIAKITADTTAEVEKSLKRFLILDAIADQQHVQVTREDLESQIHMAATRSGRKPQDIADQLQKSGQVNQVVAEIREAKALEVFLDRVLGRASNPGHGEAGHVHGPDCNH
jgi:trigger factor